MPWKFEGSPHYLTQQADRLGMDRSTAHRSRDNRELLAISTFLCQMSDRMKAANKAGVHVFHGADRAQIEAGFNAQELNVHKLHMLAATASAVLDEARAAFGLPPMDRPFLVLSDHSPHNGKTDVEIPRDAELPDAPGPATRHHSGSRRPVPA